MRLRLVSVGGRFVLERDEPGLAVAPAAICWRGGTYVLDARRGDAFCYIEAAVWTVHDLPTADGDLRESLR